MGLGASLFLVAVGAILAFAVHAHATGIDVHAVGLILLVVGVLGGCLSLLFWSSWAGPGYVGRGRSTLVDDPAGATVVRRRRTTIIE